MCASWARSPTALLTGLAGQVGALTGQAPHRDAAVWLDVDDTMRETHGYAKQGAGYGYNKVKGLNALLAICSTPATAPVIVGQRLRRGGTNSARGAGKFISDSIASARRAGATGTMRLRADSAYYTSTVVAAAHAGGAQFSITARMDAAVRKAIAAIDEDSWVDIKYPQAIFDDEQQRWISDAQVAETSHTAFTSKGSSRAVTARLIVRRVKRLNPAGVGASQTELFAAYRHHAVFTDSTESMLTAEAHHRDHAIVEQVIADLKNSALAHFPSKRFNANAAWLACAVMAHNLSRAAGALAGGKLAKARTATIRTQLFNVPARLSCTARTYTLHLPVGNRRAERLLNMFDALKAPPAAT